MNSPVTHAECQAHMKEMEERFHVCIKDEKADFNEALDKVEAWVERIENKVTDMNNSINNLVKEVAIGLFLAFVAYMWGKV